MFLIQAAPRRGRGNLLGSDHESMELAHIELDESDPQSL